FHELVKAQLGAKTHWHDSDDLAMMFRGTYTSDFYRAVRDLLHDQVSLQSPSAESPRHVMRDARSLERRWRHLLSHERQYRSAQRVQPASVAG
ncbi:MAG: B12-binding domain-containing radical SAM protein, partial [Steroidobacteraceae bacterium]